MTDSLKTQLGRLGALLRAAGPEPLLQAPLVTPTDDWFPDRWNSDLESVRRMLFRLAEYAGMPELGVDVVFCMLGAKSHLPEELRETLSAAQGPNRFLGFSSDCAWFSVELRALTDPRVLIAVMAHQVARAWRIRQGLSLDPASATAEWDAVTAVLLGYGVITCNAAYAYDVHAHQRGLLAAARWAHVNRGPLAVEDLAGLLACWARLRDLPPDEVVKQLEPTQAQEFRRVWNEIAEVDLWSRLGLPAERPSAPPPPDGPRAREFPAGYAARAVHACVEQVVAATGEDGGLVPQPVPLSVPPESLPHRILAAWGRVTATASWLRKLALVADPEWDTEVVVVEETEAHKWTCLALGHIRDRDAQNHRRLREYLEALFSARGPSRDALVPQLPTCVWWSGDFVTLGERDLEAIFCAAATGAPDDELARETEWLRKYSQRTSQRLDAERPDGIPAATAGTIADTKEWWRTVSDPNHFRDDWAAFARLAGWQILGPSEVVAGKTTTAVSTTNTGAAPSGGS